MPDKKLHPNQLSASSHKEAVRLLRLGYRIAEVARAIRTSTTTVHKIAKENNIPTRKVTANEQHSKGRSVSVRSCRPASQDRHTRSVSDPRRRSDPKADEEQALTKTQKDHILRFLQREVNS